LNLIGLISGKHIIGSLRVFLSALLDLLPAFFRIASQIVILEAIWEVQETIVSILLV